MYLAYFGLKEKGFAITPDPHYLYLSDEHREALAHLLYGAGEGGGFMLLTGEVGTGKTTICRTFLEQLPQEVDVALILNPALTVNELLHTICEEFGIETPADVSSTKRLVDCLNRYLLAAHTNGRRPVLMIDEAQNLSPGVLEQIRLLTNLETHQHKLLKIFLIGQTELKTLLKQESLRQLAQRITARFHLMPLSVGETRQYIRHRLTVAGAERKLFSSGAEQRIYHLTGGIPRLINILCDRALLGAYVTQQHRVNRRIVSKAVRELIGERQTSTWRRPLYALGISLPALILLGVAGWWLGAPSHLQDALARFITPAAEVAVPETRPPPPARLPEGRGEPSATLPEHLPVPAPVSLTDPAEQVESNSAKPAPDPLTPSVSEVIPVDELMLDQRSAMTRLLARWGIRYPKGETMAPCDFAKAQGLRCRLRKSNWNKLQAYGRPAVIRLINGKGRTGYALVVGMGKDRLLLNGGTQPLQIPMTRLDPYWFGDFLLLWKPPDAGFATIDSDSPIAIVNGLRALLTRIPGWGDNAGDSGSYDQTLKEVIQRFQGHRGLAPDGIVGPETLIQLNTAASLPGIPHLQRLP